MPGIIQFPGKPIQIPAQLNILLKATFMEWLSLLIILNVIVTFAHRYE